MSGLYTGLYFLRRKGSVYENGILLPGTQNRFIAWSQIERFHWDGDILTIIPASPIMGGGGDLRVPADKRAQMESLLAKSAVVVR